MCRNRLESGRRCPCDTSEARRLRRHNAAARAAHADNLVKPERGALVLEPHAPEPADYSVGGAKIQELKKVTTDFETLKNALAVTRVDVIEEAKVEMLSGHTVEVTSDFNGTRNFPIYKVTNPDGTEEIFYAPNQLTPILEQNTILIGDKVQEIVDARVGFTDEDIYEAEQAALGDLEKQKDEAFETYMAYTNSCWEKYGDSAKMYVAMEEGDPEAKAMYDERQRLSEVSAQVSKAYYESKRKSIEVVTPMLADQQIALVKALSEIRDLGGDVTMADNSHKGAAKVLKEAVQVYPTSWIEASNAGTPPRVKDSKGRAHYTAGKIQASYKVVPDRHSTLKPADWKPDPDTVEGLGEWIPMDEKGDWTDPDTGRQYSHYLHPGERAWMRPSIEIGRTYSSDPEAKPYGKGWIRAEVKKSHYDWEKRETVVSETEKEVVWWRPKKRRVQTESVRQPELTVTGHMPDQKRRVALHEFAHRVENSGAVGNHITRIEEEFLRRRTTDPVTGEREPLSKIYLSSADERRVKEGKAVPIRKGDEVGRKDNFTNHYMGKEYGNSSYREVLSMGVESVFAGTNGALIGLTGQKADPEMKRLIVGLWASA